MAIELPIFQRDLPKHIRFNHQAPGNLRNYITISNVISMIENPFDKDKIIEGLVEKQFDNPDAKYYHMTAEDIAEAWEAKAAQSRSYGQLLDNYIGLVLENGIDSKDIEMFILDYVEGDERAQALVDGFNFFYKTFIATGRLVPIAREEDIVLPMTDDEGNQFYIKGRFDCLFYDTKTESYVIVDWKSNEEIPCEANKWTKRCLGAARGLYDLAGVKYTTQVFFYKMGGIKGDYFNGIKDPSKVKVMIVNLPGTKDESGDPIFKAIGAQYTYDEELLKKIFIYAYKKKELLRKNS